MWAVLPVKAFTQAKQRLADFLTPLQRQELAQAMFEDVLQALRDSGTIEHILVVTNDAQVADIGAAYGAQILQESSLTAPQGLNAAVAQGFGALAVLGVKHALILHADLPLLHSDDVRALCLQHKTGTISVVADRHQQGSNALLCDVPAPIAFCYGANSFTQHQAQAQKADVDYLRQALPRLQLDIDTADDVAYLLQHLPPHCASKTAALLRRLPLSSLFQTIGIPV